MSGTVTPSPQPEQPAPTVRALFAGYYRPTDAEFARLWSEAVISLDANILLNLLRYQEDNRQHFMAILDRLKDRLWLTHQAAQEYHDNRHSVMAEQAGAYDDIAGRLIVLDKALSEARAAFAKYRHHQHIVADDILSPIETATTNAKDHLLT